MYGFGFFGFRDGDDYDDDGICLDVGWVVVVRAFWVMGVWVDVVFL